MGVAAAAEEVARTSRPRWARAGSTVLYTAAEVQELEPVRANVEKQASLDLRDIFLCHAWDDRQGAAKDLYDLLKTRGVKVWFSEEDIRLGVPFLREIDRGLAKSRIGIVLVTPNFLKRIRGESIADKELSVLLQQGQIVPIMHGTTFDALREISPIARVTQRPQHGRRQHGRCRDQARRSGRALASQDRVMRR